MKIGVLNNLRAGRSRDKVSRILSLLRAYPRVHHVETDSTGPVPDALADLAQREIDLLIVNGGDGTLQHTLGEILGGHTFERVPLIAPLRGGRTNMTALDVGSHRDPVRGLHALLTAVDSGGVVGRLVERPVLRIESYTRRSVCYGMFFGAGMILRAIALTHRLFPTGLSQGVFGAGVVTAALLARAAFRQKAGVLVPDKAQVWIDGELVPQGEFALVIGTSLRRLFLRMNPFWGKEDGRVRFTCVASGAPQIGAAAPGILRGRPRPFVTPEAGFTSRNGHRVELHLDAGYTVDGEIFSDQPDEVIRLTAERRVTFVRA